MCFCSYGHFNSIFHLRSYLEKKRKKRYIKFKENVSKNVNPNISITTLNDSETRKETQINA